MPKNSKTKKKAAAKPAKKWSAHVMETSDALDLKQGIFNSEDPKKIATSLKHSAEASKRRKGTPLQSAMSMLNFYINRGGKNLSKHRKEVLEKAKDHLHELFKPDEGKKSKH